ncbi:MAG TPA: hypothetical protein VHV74_14185 [Pseudonocardiaceae bacterium]|nr:hypothetical protein [Pseudonocardiaceae bacterium]
MRGRRWLLAAVLMVAAAGCGIVSGTATAAGGASTVPSSEPSAAAPGFRYQVQTTITERDDAHIIRKYPKYTIQADPGALPAGVADAAAAVLNGSVGRAVSDFEATGHRNGYEDVFAQGQKWDIAITPQPTVRADSILTLSYTASESFGGEGDEEPVAVTVDMRTGTRLGLTRLFTGGNTADLARLVTDALREKVNADTLPGGSPVPLVPEEITDILANGRWYPDSDGFHVLPPSGVVGNVASGAANVDIPSSDLSDITTPFAKATWAG